MAVPLSVKEKAPIKGGGKEKSKMVYHVEGGKEKAQKMYEEGGGNEKANKAYHDEEEREGEAGVRWRRRKGEGGKKNANNESYHEEGGQ